jgi:hypothetical protein
MSKIMPGLLNDTYNLIQLARETALAKGRSEQATRLSPVVDDLRSMVNSSRQPVSGTAPTPGGSASPAASAPSGILGQNDFKALLEAARSGQRPQAANAARQAGDRLQMVAAMAAGNMSEVEIARQLGMAREEVRLILEVNQKAKARPEVIK